MLIFGDLHAHSTHPVTGPSYLNLSISALQQIRYFAREHKEKNIIHLGDTFQLKDRIPSRVWNAFTQELKLWMDAGITSYWLMGNHDILQIDSTIKALHIAWPLVIPICTSCVRKIEDIDCSFLPFHGGDPDCGTDFLFMHDYIMGHSKLPFGYAEEGLQLNLIIPYRGVFAGHLHVRQEIAKNIWHVGSPYQTNFGEAGHKKYFVQLTSKGIKWHEFKFPKFINIEWDETPLPATIPGNYFKIKYKTNKYTESEIVDAKRKLLQYGALNVILEPEVISTVKERIKIKDSMHQVDYLREYVKYNAGGLDRDRLYTTGKQFMEVTND